MPGPYGLFQDETGLPTTARSGIKYEVSSLSYREGWIEGANSTSIDVRVKTKDWPKFVTDMVGRVYVTGTAPSRKLRRDLPERNPFYPEQWCVRVEQLDQGGDPSADPSLLVATNTWADADPATLASAWPVTLWIRARIVYQGLPFKLLTDAQADAQDALGFEAELNRYVERERVTIARELGFPGGKFRIIDDTLPPLGGQQPLQQTGFKLVPTADVTYRWHRVPVDALPLSTLADAIGKINFSPFDTGPGGYNFAAETLLFSGWDDRQKIWDPDGTWVVDPLMLNFRWRKSGWNKFLNNKAEMVGVSLDGTSSGQKPYETSGLFPRLFRCEP